MEKNKKIQIVSVMMCILMSGCLGVQNETPVTATIEKRTITVAAASDLTKAFTKVGEAFEAKTDCQVLFSFGSTGMLAEQIANGAPFDVFAAANEQVIDTLDDEGHILSETRFLYALGRIGVTTTKESPYVIETLEDLLSPDIEVIAIANPDHAPYGLAAKQALITAGLWERIEPKLVYGRNISETLTFITTGNADAGIVALSLKEDTIQFHLIEDDLHEPLRQAMAVVTTSKAVDLASEFVNFVNSNAGQAIMAQYGFTTPKE